MATNTLWGVRRRDEYEKLLDQDNESCEITDHDGVKQNWKFWRSEMWMKKREKTQTLAEPTQSAHSFKAPASAMHANTKREIKVKAAKKLNSIPKRYGALICFKCSKDVPNGKPFRIDDPPGENRIRLNQRNTWTGKKLIFEKTESIHLEKIFLCDKLQLNPMVEDNVGSKASHAALANHAALVCSDCMKTAEDLYKQRLSQEHAMHADPKRELKVKAAKKLDSKSKRYTALICFKCLKDVPNGKPFRIDDSTGEDRIRLNQRRTYWKKLIFKKTESIHLEKSYLCYKLQFNPMVEVKVGSEVSEVKVGSKASHAVLDRNVALVCSDCMKTCLHAKCFPSN